MDEFNIVLMWLMFNKRDKSMGENNDRCEDIYINGATPTRAIYERDWSSQSTMEIITRRNIYERLGRDTNENIGTKKNKFKNTRRAARRRKWVQTCKHSIHVHISEYSYFPHGKITTLLE